MPDSYAKILSAAYDKMVEQAIEDQLEILAALGALRTHLPGEVECDGFVSHEMWFGLMDHYGLDWPCPACQAQL